MPVSLDTAIHRFRHRQIHLMRSECVITRGSDEPPTVDPDTLEIVYGDATVVYSGRCQFRPAGLQGSEVQAGETEVTLTDFIGKLPVDTEVQKDDVWTMTSSKFDQGLVGRSFRISDVVWDDWQVSRVCKLEEVS